MVEVRPRGGRVIGRALAPVVIVCVTIVVAVMLLRSGADYVVKADFADASQLVKGDNVEVAGYSVGHITDLRLTPNGQAQVTMRITNGDYVPLREGVVATVRAASLSGVANRYIQLRLPPGEPPPISSGTTLRATETNSAVDIDQLFDMFDQPTRRALSGVVRGFSTFYGGRAPDLKKAYEYFNPALSSSARLFHEVNLDTPNLTRFLVASSAEVSDLASRQNDLAGLVDHLSNALGAIASGRTALAQAIGQLPPFMRQADTTFTTLRRTLNDLTPLVNASKPVAARLQPLLASVRPFARDARPTIRGLAVLTRNPAVPNSDLLSLLNSSVPVRNIAVGPVHANGAARPGAYPSSVQALNSATPELAFAVPYSTDLQSWFMSYATTGDQDALGGAVRNLAVVDAGALIGSSLTPIPPQLRGQAFGEQATVNQRNRCPGSAEHGTVYRPASDFNCDPAQTLPGS